MSHHKWVKFYNQKYLAGGYLGMREAWFCKLNDVVLYLYYPFSVQPFLGFHSLRWLEQAG